MKKLTALALALILALSLAACNGGGNTLNNNTSTELPNIPLQGDIGSVHTEDNERTFEQAPNTNTNLPQEDETIAYTDDVESISIDIMAANAYVINVDTNSVLYEKNSNERIAPASTAKILAALTALDYCALEDTFTVGSEIDLIASDSSKAGLNNGDTLTFRQLLAALLLPSGNDAAYTLAVNAGRIIAGDNSLNSKQAIKLFVDAMNNKAKEAGATSSNFVTPDGYDADGQYTTAVDLAQIAKVCLDNDVLSEITSSYKIYDTLTNGREIVYSNTNELLNPNSQYYYSNAIGLKTGTTGNAGSCLISAATINEQTYICVVMGSSAGVRFSDSLAVFSAIDPTISLPVETGGAPGSAPGGRTRG